MNKMTNTGTATDEAHNKMISLDDLETDELSLALLPKTHINKFKPLKTLGDGSCMYNAISLVLSGDYSLSKNLRQRTSRELANNAENCAKHPHLMQAVETMGCDLLTLLQSTLGEREQRRRGHNITEWSSIIQALALSTVIKCTIVSVFPDVEYYARPCVEQSNH